ncbi:MAG: zinc-ribbon domain-containing protein [Candidatus Hodarchaeota archaeon]
MIMQEEIFWLFFIITMIIVGVILFVLFIKLLIWLYRDANRRNMDGTLWVLIVVVSGLIGLIIYFIIRDPIVPEKAEQLSKPAAPQPEHKAEVTREVKYCSACGSPVSETAEFCSLCGEKLK